MDGNFNNVNLPGVNLTTIKWPSFKRTSLTQVETKVMDLNPRFGTILNEPFNEICDQFWKPIFKF